VRVSNTLSGSLLKERFSMMWVGRRIRLERKGALQAKRTMLPGTGSTAYTPTYT
jgi:hypothetical protein